MLPVILIINDTNIEKEPENTFTIYICSASNFLDYFTSFPNPCTRTGLALIPVLQQ